MKQLLLSYKLLITIYSIFVFRNMIPFDFPFCYYFSHRDRVFPASRINHIALFYIVLAGTMGAALHPT
ncbi:MAG: hypothetical protein LBI60_03500 [Bacteroidales bacterium]|nr:hypothetical protein [Bacteroidales bacterium]